MDYEKFYGKLWKQGESLVITVPSNIIKGCGYKEGDVMKIMIQKDDFVSGDKVK